MAYASIGRDAIGAFLPVVFTGMTFGADANEFEGVTGGKPTGGGPDEEKTCDATGGPNVPPLALVFTADTNILLAAGGAVATGGGAPAKTGGAEVTGGGAEACIGGPVEANVDEPP